MITSKLLYASARIATTKIFRAIGVGTERCEAQLNKQFPTVPVLRIDSDSTRGKHKLPQLLAEILTGQPCIFAGYPDAD